MALCASSSVRGVHARRCALKGVVFFCAFVAALCCVVAFPGVVVVAALKTSFDDESFGDTTTTHVSPGEKMSSKSFAFATPASKGLSANSLEVRGR